MKIRVVIVDDHRLVLDGLSKLVKSIPDVELQGTATNGQELLFQLAQLDCLPNVILLDIDMPIMNGIETARMVKTKYPPIRLLLLTMHDESIYHNKAVGVHAHGLITKSASQSDLRRALIVVSEGRYYFQDRAQKPLASVADKVANLTTREIEILQKIALGMSNTEISRHLGISVRTVDTHRTNLKKKLSVDGIAGLVRYAFQQGYLR